MWTQTESRAPEVRRGCSGMVEAGLILSAVEIEANVRVNVGMVGQRRGTWVFRNSDTLEGVVGMIGRDDWERYARPTIGNEDGLGMTSLAWDLKQIAMRFGVLTKIVPAALVVGMAPIR